jgi:hypothetical protein
MPQLLFLDALLPAGEGVIDAPAHHPSQSAAMATREHRWVWRQGLQSPASARP